jgi:hypothetical protein
VKRFPQLFESRSCGVADHAITPRMDRLATAKPFLDAGFDDISPAGSKQPCSLLLRHVSGPTSGPVPVEGCPTQVHYVGRLMTFGGVGAVAGKHNEVGEEEEDIELIFESTRDVVNGRSVGGADMPVQIQLLRPDVTYANSPPEPGIDRTLQRPPGLAWDLALARMHKGEVRTAVLVFKNRYSCNSKCVCVCECVCANPPNDYVYKNRAMTQTTTTMMSGRNHHRYASW